MPGVCNGNLKRLYWHISGWLDVWHRYQTARPDCHHCMFCLHDEIDRRTHFVDAAYAKECALEGMARTQVIWLKEGVIKA
ncbi:DUF1364 family protein [Escherichia coli]|nr:DUF1364 family protein [Escherichia coli]